MLFWQWLWTALWFGGLAVFTVLSVVIAIQGGRDLLALLHALRSEADAAPVAPFDSGPQPEDRWEGHPGP
jgi:hypothetical protein